ncbi:MAG: hypothetical protein AABX19_01330 [Nanoarchaeota archaeon]
MEKYKRIVKDNYLEDIVGINVGIKKDEYYYTGGKLERDELGFYVYGSLTDDFPNFTEKRYYLEDEDIIEIPNPERLFDIKRVKYRESKSQIRKRKEIREIFDVTESGANSLKEIHDKTGLTIDKIRKYASQTGIELKDNLIGEKDQKSTENINDLVEKVKSLRPRRKNSKDIHRPEIDKFIEQGLSLSKIGKNVNLSGERIRQYIINTGQYNDYRKKREYVKEKKSDERVYFLYVLEERISQLLEKEDIAYQKAVEYKINMKTQDERAIPFEKILSVFQRYYEAKDNGIKLSLKELENITGIGFSYVSRILKRVGLEPLYGTMNKRDNTTNKEIEIIINRANSGMSTQDIGYFLELPSYIIEQTLSRRKIKKARAYYRYKINGRGNYLYYRTASQVYEAQDLGFTNEEITELVETKKEIVDLALEKRVEIEPRIIKELKILYNNPDINKPYKN